MIATIRIFNNENIFADRVVPLGVDHFSQNGNVKNISHIDVDVIENENGNSSIQKLPVVEKLNEKLDIEMAINEPKLDEKKEPSENGEKKSKSIFKYPKEKSVCHQIMWIIIWPTQLLFMLTIPNCETKRFKNLFPLTFLMCIVWIGSLSYLVAWMITIVGLYFSNNLFLNITFVRFTN